MDKYSVIGIMSGSSMDGVDLACCELEKKDGNWSYRIVKGETIPYDEKWRVRLSQLYKQPIELFPKTDFFYGRYLGMLVKDFIKREQLHVHFIASHGHTIFHQPDGGFTAQIGNGAALAAVTNLPVVSDFRSMDVVLGGQGAPLVPIGDALFFNEYDACLNLGGFANISIRKQNEVKAWDISGCNILLNRVARWMGQKYDDKGEIARSAEPDPAMLEELNNLPYYRAPAPKSLGREWINTELWPIVKRYPDTAEAEKMATLSEHIAVQIAASLETEGLNKVLVTGGGAFNEFLIEKLRARTHTKLQIPDETLVNYKEALIFALLGVLRLRNEENILSSVTGASRNCVSGALHGDFSGLSG